jgi:hypothetical protein
MAPAPIRYTYGWSDYVALDRALRQESFLKRYQLVVVPVFLTSCIAAVSSGMDAWKGQDFFGSLSALVSTGWFWLTPVAIAPLIHGANHIELRLWYRRQRADGMEVEVKFDEPGGLSLASRDGAGTISWDAIRKVSTTDNMHVVLQNNRVVGVCLPRRAFASDSDFDGVKSFIDAKIKERRGTP